MRSKQVKPVKCTKATYRQYTKDNIEEALQLLKKGVSVRRAAVMTGVPRMTLQDRANGRVSPTTWRSGPSSLFTQSEEKVLVAHINRMARLGYPYTRLTLRILATDASAYLKKNRALFFSKKHGPEAGLLSETWLKKFLCRNPELTCEKPKKLDKVSPKPATSEVILEYFKELDNILREHNLHDHPESIFYVDETRFSVDSKPTLGKPVRRLRNGEFMPYITSEKGDTTTTLIGCCSATGQFVPPFFVFKGKRFNRALLEGASPGCGYTLSDNGCSNSTVLHQYLANHLRKSMPQGEGPVLILYDGHTSHISGPLIEWAREHNFILFVLPPQSSQSTQRLNVGCFGPFKQAYSKECEEYLKEHVGQVITKYSICSLACSAYAKSLTSANIISAFECTGIYPFDRTKIGPDILTSGTVTNPAAAPSDPQ